MANANAFSLYALLNDSSVGSGYRLSMAVYPKVGEPGASLGSFTFNGTAYNVTRDMTYGAPPLSALYPDLSRHNIFETYYTELEIGFDPSRQCAQYDAQSQAGDPATLTGSGLYYTLFNVDVSALADGYGIHFDLYQLGSGANDKPGIVAFAPFSHDAASGVERDISGPPARVPDGGVTAALLGVAMASLGLARMRRR